MSIRGRRKAGGMTRWVRGISGMVCPSNRVSSAAWALEMGVSASAGTARAAWAVCAATWSREASDMNASMGGASPLPSRYRSTSRPSESGISMTWPGLSDNFALLQRLQVRGQRHAPVMTAQHQPAVRAPALFPDERQQAGFGGHLVGTAVPVREIALRCRNLGDHAALAGLVLAAGFAVLGQLDADGGPAAVRAGMPVHPVQRVRLPARRGGGVQVVEHALPGGPEDPAGLLLQVAEAHALYYSPVRYLATDSSALMRSSPGGMPSSVMNSRAVSSAARRLAMVTGGRSIISTLRASAETAPAIWASWRCGVSSRPSGGREAGLS